MRENVSDRVVKGFGDEWSRFDQTALDGAERRRIFDQYFALMRWEQLPADARCADIGCGSGRWAAIASERVGELHCVDPSGAALDVARTALGDRNNVRFHQADVGNLPLEDGSLDFVYSLGVLHHVPDTLMGLKSCVRTLKRGAPIVIYLYYAFDNRPRWFRAVWRVSDVIRRLVSSLPYQARFLASQVLAATVYLPLATVARLLSGRGVNVEGFPLSAYADKSFYTMRTDALDRFGTGLEKRFTKAEVIELLEAAGCERVEVGGPPYWCAIGYRR